MLSWLSGLASDILGTIDDIKKWFLRIIQSVYTFLDNEFHALELEFVSAWNSLNSFISAVDRYAVSVWNTLTLLIRVQWQETVSWVSGVLEDLRRYIDNAVSWLNRQLALIVTTLHKYIDDTILWLQKNILDPLIASVGNIITWLRVYGMFMWNLISHPDALVAYIGRYLWSAWLGLIKSHAAPIGRWFLHTMLSLAGEFADVLETILSAII